ncbi:MAG: GTPase Era [Rickettsiales bacterium]|jgi:GTP-binding protein Era|nr:GTPase Era [Rickettsiales bacterium]
MAKKTKSGFVAIIGPTNAGKSTLLNAIMGRKAAIVSHKVQTTRTQLRAVKMVGDPSPQSGAEAGAQLIFVDTPGFFRPARKLDRAMAKSAADSLADADAVVLLIDAKHGITETVGEIIKKLSGKNIFAAINKVDEVKKESLLPLAQKLADFGVFQEIFMISALKNQGVGEMLDALAEVMPESPYLFDPKDAVDVPDALWLAEITREKIYKFVHQELPYHIHVSTDKMETDGEGVVEVSQTIYVKTDGHKKIIIGAGGAQLKRIGTAARREIQDEWGVNARLRLFVRVEDWENSAERYAEQGLSYVK